MSSPEQAAREFEALGRALKGAPKDLRRESLRELRSAGKPAIQDVKASALATLPNRGGLNALVAASSIGVRTRLAGRSPGIRIKATGKRARQLKSIDESGSWRRPTFGRAPWKTQTYAPAKGWFTETINEDKPRFVAAIEAAVKRMSEKVIRSI